LDAPPPPPLSLALRLCQHEVVIRHGR